jgi:hypothetical protein
MKSAKTSGVHGSCARNKLSNSSYQRKNSTAFRTQAISFDKHPLDYLTVESSSIVERHPTFPGFRVSPMTLQWPYLTNLETEMVLLSGVSQTTILSRGGSNQIKQKHINQPH